MWVQIAVVLALVALARPHGRVLAPAGRGSLWRAGYSVRANYDDDGLNCGGFYHQYSVTGGKCGVCGDPYDSSQPRAHERGGIYDAGIIAGSYEAGAVFTASVQLSAYHKGYWEFMVCPVADYNEQDCFEPNLLELEDGGTKYYPTQSATYNVNYRLPAGLTCDNCLLQWRYTAGNNWGDCGNGTQGLGCGNQETFWACSDIEIVASEIENENVVAPLIPVQYLQENLEQGVIQMLINAATRPHDWIHSAPRKKSRTKPKRPKRPKRPKKKKGKPYRQKWASSWRNRI